MKYENSRRVHSVQLHMCIYFDLHVYLSCDKNEKTQLKSMLFAEMVFNLYETRHSQKYFFDLVTTSTNIALSDKISYLICTSYDVTT